MTVKDTLSSRICIICKPCVRMDSTSSDPHETLRPQLSKTAQNKLHQPSVEETPHFEAPSAQIKYQGWTPGFSAFQTRSSERMPPPYSRPGLLNFSELAETRIRQIIHISGLFHKLFPEIEIHQKNIVIVWGFWKFSNPLRGFAQICIF